MKNKGLVVMQVTPCADDVFELKVVLMGRDNQPSWKKLRRSLMRLIKGNNPREISFLLQIMGERDEEETVIFPKGEDFRDVIAYLSLKNLQY